MVVPLVTVVQGAASGLGRPGRHAGCRVNLGVRSGFTPHGKLGGVALLCGDQEGDVPMALRRRGISGPQLVVAGFALVSLVTILLWIAGVISNAATVTAYATMLLAIGTASLAFGAIGTYVEQRKANLEQHTQITMQNFRLEAAKENDIAQVVISRTSGPGEFLKVDVANNSSRVIRSVYVWATVSGLTGHYLAVVPPESAFTSTFASRRMEHTPRIIDGDIVEWCYRSLQPGTSKTFDQFRVTNQDAIPSSVADGSIRANAAFIDFEGYWWKCSEDGTVEKLPEGSPVVAKQQPVEGHGLYGPQPAVRVSKTTPVG